MVENAPFQNVYFNALAARNTPEEPIRKFDLDYWGTSYKQSLEYILKNDTSPVIHVAVYNKPGEFNFFILRDDQRKRIKLEEDISKATYFITNYREHDKRHDLKIKAKEIHSIKVGNQTINSVYKLK